MSTLITVPFHQQTLLATTIDNVPYVAMKPICENLGLDWEAQRQRIQRHPVLNQVACMIKATSIGQDGKSYLVEMLMIPIRYINGWLFGVDSARVNADAKEKVIEYQRECFDVLANHFMPTQYNQPQPALPKAPRAKLSLPGGLTLEQQDLINDTIAERLAVLPKEKQGKAAQLIRGALVTKWELKGVKHGYKNIPEDQFTNAMNFIARLELDGDCYLTLTKDDMEAKISERIALLPKPDAKEGELLPKSENTLAIDLSNDGILSHMYLTFKGQPNKVQNYVVSVDRVTSIFAVAPGGHFKDLPAAIAVPNGVVSDEQLPAIIQAASSRLKDNGYVVVKRDELKSALHRACGDTILAKAGEILSLNNDSVYQNAEKAFFATLK